VDDIIALLADEEIELVVINTPDESHHPYVERAIQYGKHVIVEKPFTYTTGQALDLVFYADNYRSMISVYQNRRYDGDFLTVKEIIDRNLLGRLVEFESTFSRYRNFIKPNTWKEQKSGMVYNLGSHLIDQCVALFGIPQAVWADTAVLREGGMVDDYFCIHLFGCAKAPDLRVTLKAGYLMREPEPRFVLHGTEGSYVKYGVDIQEEKLQQGCTPDAPDWGIEPEERWGTITTDSGKQKYPTLKGDYMAFYESVYQRLRHGKRLDFTAMETVPTITIIEAALESSREKKVIDIDYPSLLRFSDL